MTVRYTIEPDCIQFNIERNVLHLTGTREQFEIVIADLQGLIKSDKKLDALRKREHRRKLKEAKEGGA